MKQYSQSVILVSLFSISFGTANEKDVSLRKYWMTQLRGVLPKGEYKGKTDSRAHRDCLLKVDTTQLNDPEWDSNYIHDHRPGPMWVITQSYSADLEVKGDNGEFRKVNSFEMSVENKFALAGTEKTIRYIGSDLLSYYFGNPEQRDNVLSVGALKGTPRESELTYGLDNYKHRALVLEKKEDGKLYASIEGYGSGGSKSDTCILEKEVESWTWNKDFRTAR